jgi:hypothetical protein
VVVHDLDAVGIPVTPHRTKTPLVVDPDTVLPLPLAAQGFQTVPMRCCQIAQLRGAVQLAKLSARDPFHGSKTTTRQPVVKSLGFRAAERPDHLSIVFRVAFNVKRYFSAKPADFSSQSAVTAVIDMPIDHTRK